MGPTTPKPQVEQNTLQSVLDEIGINSKGLKDLHDKAFSVQEDLHEQLAAALVSLHKANATLSAHQELYEAVIQNADDADTLTRAFLMLKEAGITVQDHQTLYDAVIQNADDADTLARAFLTLKEAGITVQVHQTLYDAVIKNTRYTDTLARAFLTLKEAGITVQVHQTLYKAVIQNARYADMLANVFKEHKDLHGKAFYVQEDLHEQLAAALVSLHKANATLPAHQELYEAVIQNADDADTLTRAFLMLKEAGITVQVHQTLYKAVIQNARYADKLTNVFLTLQDHQTLYSVFLTLQDHQTLYEAVIKKAGYADTLARAFLTLKEADITVQDQPTLYEAVIANACYADKLASGFLTLKKAGATVQVHQTLYKAVIENPLHADNLPSAFLELKEAGITVQVHQTLYKAVIQNAYYADKLATAFAALKEADITVQDHQTLYEAVIQKAYDADKLARAFLTLKEAGITVQVHQILQSVLDEIGINPKEYKDLHDKAFSVQEDLHEQLAAALVSLHKANATLPAHQELYDAVIQNADDADTLTRAFLMLKEAGITVQDHQTLYDAVIKNTRYADKLARAFLTLKEAGITVQDHQTLYDAVIQNADDADTLARAFLTLKEAGITVQDHQTLYDKEAGITVQDHQTLYDAVIKNTRYADKLASIFAALKEAGTTVQVHQTLYDAVIKDAYFSGFLEKHEQLAAALVSLHKANATLPAHQELYDAVIQNADDADTLARAFLTLKEAGITVQDHQTLYEAVIKNARYADKLASVFAALKEAGATVQDHQTLYEAVILNPYYADKLTAAFAALKNAGATFQDHSALYRLATQKISDAYFSGCLEKFDTLQFKLPANFHIISSILESNLMITTDVLSWFECKKLSVASHQYLYDIFFIGQDALIHSPYLIAKIRPKLEQYFKIHDVLSNDDEVNATQRVEIQEIINDITQESRNITQGPLNKSQATNQLEVILDAISREKMENITMRFDEALGYIIQIADKPEIYLNELLRQVNFNHIKLSDSLITNLGSCIQEMTHDFEQEPLNNNRIVRQLPETAGRALTCYVGNNRYKNINRLFRGVPQTDGGWYAWVLPVDGKNNLLANFLAGVLVNWAAAELQRKLLDSEERLILEKICRDTENKAITTVDDIKKNQLLYNAVLEEHFKSDHISKKEYDQVKDLFNELSFLFPDYGLVDRGENLQASENDGELETQKRREANPIIASSVMSLSVYPNGSAFFRNDGTVRTKIETSNATRLVINSVEGEILVSSGTSYCYSTNPAGGFFAREVNSPGIVPTGGFWSSVAIAEAFRYHLKKPYEDSQSQTTVNGTSIERPNHGLAHEYRVMVYIDIVIDYFAHHAQDETFKLFCQHISPEEREWLRVAAAYSISGRESEIAAGEDLQRYDEFRQASEDHMKAFLEKYPPASDDPAMRSRMLHIVRWMGNPGYEQDFNGKPTINDHDEPNEREHRNFIHRILTIAHKLDLPRCYGPELFNNAMALCRDLSLDSDEQNADYNQMIRYAIDLNRAHGNMLNTELLPTGQLVSCSESYREPFDKASANLRQLRELTDSISRPKLAEQYQFPACGNLALVERVLDMSDVQMKKR